MTRFLFSCEFFFFDLVAFIGCTGSYLFLFSIYIFLAVVVVLFLYFVCLVFCLSLPGPLNWMHWVSFLFSVV